MTDHAVPDPELEQLARAALRRAAAPITPSPSLAGRCLPRSAGTDRAAGTGASAARRWAGIGLAAAVVAATLIVVSTRSDDTTDVSTVDVSTTRPPKSWWDQIGSDWEDVPAPPGAWSAAAADHDQLVAWAPDSTGGGHVSQNRGSVLESTGKAWAPLESDPVGWDSGVTATTSSGTVLVAVSAERSGPDTIDHFALSATTFAADGAGTPVPLGRVGDLDSYLARTPAVLPVPSETGDIAWVFSHDDVSGALTIAAVSRSGRHDVPSIDRPALRPLAVGWTAAGHPVLLTQALDATRNPTDVIAFELTADAWQERSSESYPEADATWTGDRFVVVSTDDRTASTTGAAATITVGEDEQVTWSATDSPGLQSCESPIRVIGDGTGGAVAFTACGDPTFLPSGQRSWIRLPSSGGARITPVAATDGVVIGRSDATPVGTLVAIRPTLSR